jgi:hypothetical protein
MTIRLTHPSILDVTSKNGMEVKVAKVTEILCLNIWYKL